MEEERRELEAGGGSSVCCRFSWLRDTSRWDSSTSRSSTYQATHEIYDLEVPKPSYEVWSRNHATDSELIVLLEAEEDPSKMKVACHVRDHMDRRESGQRTAGKTVLTVSARARPS